jgi:RNA polymerase sigma-70 factor (ECF subfamily)
MLRVVAAMDGPSDQTLVVRVVVDADRHAFATLVRRHQSVMRAFARRLAAGDGARADDTAQEAFVLAWKHLHTWRGEGTLLSWLLKLCFRVHLSEGRRAHHRRESREQVERAHAAIDSTARRDVNDAMRILSDAERAALALVFQQGLTHEEAAQVLDVPLGTLKSHITRGKDKLRPLLMAYAEEAA